MSAQDLTRLASESLQLVLLLSAPVLLVSLAVGLVIAALQTAMQLQELTLSFVPKLFAVALVLAFSGAWMGTEVVRFTTHLWQSIPQLVR